MGFDDNTTTKDILTKLQLLAAKYDKEYDDPGEYWESGNMDDVFSFGEKCGQNSIYKEIKDILNGN